MPDIVPWGFMEDGVFVALPLRPMLEARLGPPPFDVTLPSGEVRHIIEQPERRSDGEA